MRKKILSALIAGFMLFSVGESAFAVRYREVSHENKVKYRDNLENGDMSDWDVFISANKKWSMGEYNGKNALVCTSDSTWLFSAITPHIPETDMKNCRVSADFIFKERFERSGFIFRASDDRNLYEVNFGVEAGAGIMAVSKRRNSSQWEEVTLYSASPQIALNKPVNMAVEISGNHFDIYIDNQLMYAYTDTDNPLTDGKVGLLHEYGTTRMMNFKITAVDVKEEAQAENKYKYKSYAYYDDSEINDFSDAICDFYGWDDYGQHIVYFENNNLIIVPDTEDDFYKMHTVSYVKKRFDNQPIELEAKGVGAQYTVSFKNPSPNSPANYENDGYNLRVCEDKVYLEKWIAGKNELLGEADGNFMSADEYKSIKILTENDNEALNISVYFGDENIINARDTQNVISGEGYISILSYLDELFIRQSENKDKTLKQLMGTTNAALLGSSDIYFEGTVSKLDQCGSCPYSENKNVMLPLKGLAQKVGAGVLWNGENKTIEVKYNGNEYVLADGFGEYFKNGAVVPIDGMCKIKDGVTYVPQEFYQNEFGLSFDVMDNGLIIISYTGDDISGVLADDVLLNAVYEKLK